MPLVHRWIKGRDLVALLWLLRQLLDEAGSLEAYFARGWVASAADVSDALESFSTRARAIDLRPAYGRVPKTPGAALIVSTAASSKISQKISKSAAELICTSEIKLVEVRETPLSSLILNTLREDNTSSHE